MADIASILAAKRPTTGSVDIVLDPALADAYHEAAAAHDEARAALRVSPDDAGLKKALRAAADALAVATDAVQPAVVTFSFRSLGKAEYAAIKDAHAPSEDQLESAKTTPSLASMLYVDPDTFPQALVSACAVDPEIPLSDAEQMWKSPDWNDGELEELFWTAQHLQRSRRTSDLGKGSGPTPS